MRALPATVAGVRSILPYITLLALAALSTWHLSRLQDDLGRERSDAATLVRLKGQDITLVAVNEAGRTEYLLEVDEVQDLTDESGARLISPRLSFPHQDRPTSRARSDRGWVSEDRSQVHLIDNVYIEHVTKPDTEKIVLTTAFLELHPETKTAQTNLPVRIQQGTSVVEAVGMRAEMAGPRMELLSQVRSRFVPARPTEKPQP